MVNYVSLSRHCLQEEPDALEVDYEGSRSAHPVKLLESFVLIHLG